MIDDEKGYQYAREGMLMRQRDTAEEERDSWKIRAMKAEVERQALRAEVVDLREDRDSQKLRAETAERDRQTLLIKGTKFEQEWQALTTANTSLRDLLTLWEGQRDQAKADAEHWKGEWAVVMGQLGGARAEVEALRKYAAQWYEHITLKAAIAASMAVQPTTGDKHE